MHVYAYACSDLLLESPQIETMKWESRPRQMSRLTTMRTNSCSRRVAAMLVNFWMNLSDVARPMEDFSLAWQLRRR